MQDDVEGGNGRPSRGTVGHFYFAQIGHFYFAATGCGRGRAREHIPGLRRYFTALRTSPRLTWTRRRPSSRFPAAFCLAASLICTRLFTTAAPAVLHMRVAVPLCCRTSVLPSMVATPPCTRTVNLSVEILDLANLARMTASNCTSLSFGWTVTRFGVTVAA